MYRGACYSTIYLTWSNRIHKSTYHEHPENHNIPYIPMVVVFPPPFTPTIIMTAGRLQKQDEPTMFVGWGKLLKQIS